MITQDNLGSRLGRLFRKMNISHDTGIMMGILLGSTEKRYEEMIQFMETNPNLEETVYFQEALRLRQEIPDGPEEEDWEPDED